ncbi:MAG: MarR family transcriptional regulator [Rhodospirillales bacterium]|nr:MarR family transcriptional regulator [Rhodospirillales bacterium]
MKHTSKGSAFTEIALEIFRLNGALLAAGDKLGADLGITSARWQIMGALGESSMTVPQIANEMGLTRQGVQRTVNILLEEGIVELHDNPNHKRAKLVRLSSEGAHKLNEISMRQISWANSLADKFTEDDLQTANQTIHQLRLMITNLDNERG